MRWSDDDEERSNWETIEDWGCAIALVCLALFMLWVMPE